MLRDLVFPLAGRRARSASWDRTGANADHVVVESGASHALLDVAGAGMITHLWIPVNTENPTYLHGTGTEDYFGVSVAGEPERTPLEYAGTSTMYRFHLADPIRFERAIQVTIEHGHANCHADDDSSVAYWYQTPGGPSRRCPWRTSAGPAAIARACAPTSAPVKTIDK